MKVKVDRGKCHKSGECYYNHPELFSMGDEGYPEILHADVAEQSLVQHAREAAQVCPAVAIELIE